MLRRDRNERHEEVQALLGDAQTIADQERFRALSREYAQLSDVSRCFTDWQQVQEDIETAQMMLDDPEMREMAQDELREAKEKSGVLSFVVDGVHPYDIGMMLDKLGIAIRTGHHCAEPLVDWYDIPGTARASFAFYNTKAEIDYFISSLKRVLMILK